MTLYSFWLGGFVVVMGLNLGIMVEAKVTHPLYVVALVIAAVFWPVLIVILLGSVWTSKLQ